MPTVPFATRARRMCALAALALGVVAVTGCGSVPDDELDRGRQLFQERCGACHTLAEAGTAAQVAPDLDAAFADARAVGMDDATIAGVTRKQIAHPRFTEPDSPDYMPADLVVGRDADAVANYVGKVAGVPDIEPASFADIQELFVQSCGSCHTLAEAGTQATTGPDLDEVLPGQDADDVLTAIVSPGEQVTPGFPAGVMPENYGELFTQEELEELVQYLLDAVNGNGG